MRDSYPYEWIQTLDAAEKLDFEYVIGGHGEVMHGKQKFELLKQYFRDLLESTTAAYVEGKTMEKAKKRVSEFLTAKYADKFDHFPQNVAGDVAKAYAPSTKRTFSVFRTGSDQGEASIKRWTLIR
jgi:hypothetical protein